MRDDHLVEAVDEVRAELARADTKASTLLALAGAVAAITAASPLVQVDGAPGWIVRAGLVLLAVAVAVLLAVVRPQLGSAPFERCAEEGWRPETPAERMTALSKVARRKFRRLRTAVDVLSVAGGVLAVGIVWLGVVS